MKFLKLILLVALSGGCFAFQEPQDGTPACNNYKSNSHKCSCGKAMKCGMNGHGSGDPDEYRDGIHKCQNACRKDLCACLSPCTSRRQR